MVYLCSIKLKTKNKMKCYLRFTEDFSNENVSYFKTPSMKKAVKLNGLCAFSFCHVYELKSMSQEEIEKKIDEFRDAYWIYDKGTAVLFEGEYLGNNNNGEGVIVKKGELLYVSYKG